MSSYSTTELKHGRIKIMKRWIIKVHSVAKKDNPSFAGEVRDYYYGKGEELLHRIEQTNLKVEELNPLLIKDYGFIRKSGASRALNVYRDWRNGYPEKYWDETQELIEVEV